MNYVHLFFAIARTIIFIMIVRSTFRYYPDCSITFRPLPSETTRHYPSWTISLSVRTTMHYKNNNKFNFCHLYNTFRRRSSGTYSFCFHNDGGLQKYTNISAVVRLLASLLACVKLFLISQTG